MIAIVFSFFLGAIAVLQGGLNKQIMKSWGLASAILLNSSILIVIALIFWGISQKFPQIFPSYLHNKSSGGFSWWYVLPGFCGFSLIAGIPALIPKIGAAGVFLGIVVGQMFFSILWDLNMENMAIEPKRLLGVLLAVIGLFLSWKA